jgi:nickel/cobalt transporter (NicO) family protein
MRKIVFVIFFLLFFSIANTSIYSEEQNPIKVIQNSKIVQTVIPVQKELNKKLSDLAYEIKYTKSKKALFIVLALAFVFGMAHALSPGHGKTLVFSYFLSKRANVTKGILLGNLIAFLHAGSAVIIVLLLYLVFFVFKKSYLVCFSNASQGINIISYIFISLLGLFLLIKAIFIVDKKKDKKNYSLIHRHKKYDKIIPSAVFVGIVPCPGSLIILLFAVSLGLLQLGLMAVVFIALGMGVTISITGILTKFFKNKIIKISSKRKKTGKTFQKTTEIIGALIILCLGLFLLVMAI